MSDDVTQEDRLAVISALADRGEYITPDQHASYISGLWDDNPLVLAFAAHRIAGEQAGHIAGLEAAARYIQDQYPHDKRVLVPAIRKLGRVTDAAE